MAIRPEKNTADDLHYDLIHHIFSFLTSPADFASASLINKHWYAADASFRRYIKVNNCFAVSPRRLTRRFHALTSLTLVARPDKSTDVKWRVNADRWIECLATSYRGLQVLQLKKFVLSYRLIRLIAESFSELRSLVFVGCHEIPSFGLGWILRNCRHLEALELRDCSGLSDSEPWLSDFPENCESLLSLSFVNTRGVVDIAVLERVVMRFRNLKCLKFDQHLPPDVFTRILEAAPQLTELGVGTSLPFPPNESITKFADAIINCTSVQSLSGPWLPTNLIYLSTWCSKLLFLDLTKMSQRLRFGISAVTFIEHCHKLQQFWILSSAGDLVLQAVGKTCIDLRELKVIPLYGRKFFEASMATATVTDAGLLAVSMGCRKLQSITYSCQCMSNAALITFAQQNPEIRKFKLTLQKQEARDIQTSESFDEGFGVMLQSCKNLIRLTIRNAYVTDQVFFFAGMFGAKLKKLSVAFAGDSNVGIFYALNLCLNLRQLVIRGTSFGDDTLLAAVEKFNNLQLVWVGSCGVTVKGSKTIRETCSSLNVDIMDAGGKIEEDLACDMEAQNLLIYHRLKELNEVVS